MIPSEKTTQYLIFPVRNVKIKGPLGGGPLN